MAVLQNLKFREDTRHQIFLCVLDELAYFDVESVADTSGVHFTTIYKWLRGEVMNPSVRTLFAVADAVGLEIEVKHKKGRARTGVTKTGRKLRIVE